MTKDHRASTLRRLVREARAEKPATLDFEQMEERLVRALAREAKPTVGRARSLYPLAWGTLAAAAALVLWLVSNRAPTHVAPAARSVIEATEPLRKNGDSMALGATVTAAEREVSVAHPGRATWTLSPGSSATLLSKASHIDVRLDRGSVLAEVAPNPKPESFVIEAANARIAVHGTVFRVELTGEHVIVNVREGTVAVGARGAVPAFFLKAPAHGEFTLDGRSGSIDGRPVGAGDAPRKTGLKSGGVSRAPAPTVSQSAPPAEPSAPETTPEPSAQPPKELPFEPSISDIETGIAPIVESTSECFSQNTKGAEGVQITVRTALTLQIDSSGDVADADFQPPLSPEVEACATSSIARVAFAPSIQGAKVTRMLDLKR